MVMLIVKIILFFFKVIISCSCLEINSKREILCA